jgi:hypothetical protein
VGCGNGASRFGRGPVVCRGVRWRLVPEPLETLGGLGAGSGGDGRRAGREVAAAQVTAEPRWFSGRLIWAKRTMASASRSSKDAGSNDELRGAGAAASSTKWSMSDAVS